MKQLSLRRDGLSLVLYLLLVMGAGLAIGSLTRPDSWYAGLAKPWFNPPNWVFGPVWTVLYVFIAIAGWRIWHRGSNMLLALWSLQLVLNFLWSPAFFAMHGIGLALMIVLLLLAAILATLAVARREDRISAWLFVPYAAWVSFASLLNGAIWWLNGAPA